MKKALKIILRSVTGLIIFIITLPILVSLLLQVDAIQKYVVDSATEILSDIAGTPISISSVELRFFTKAQFGDVYMEDAYGDTMIYAKNVSASINGINFLNGKITLGDVRLDGGQVNLYKDSLGVMNVESVFKHFQPAVPNPNPPNFRLTAAGLTISNTRFTMKQWGCDKVNDGVDFENLTLNDINFKASDISVYNHNIWLTLDSLNLKEPSGLKLCKFSSERCGVDSSGLYFAKVELNTGVSHLHLDSLNILTANQSWWDWQDFNNKMIFSAHLTNSRLSTTTLGRLARFKLPQQRDININSAKVRGTVANLKADLSDVEFCGNRLCSDVSIKGLPNINKTNFEANLTKLTANDRTIKQALIAITGDTLQPNAMRMIRRLEKLMLSAHFNGGVNHFRCDAKIVSQSAGEIMLTSKMNKDAKGAIKLRGTVDAPSLTLKKLLGDNLIGALCLNGTYNLHIEKNQPIVINTDLNIPTLEYGHYTYQNFELDGAFNSLHFNGMVRCFDPNFRVELIGLFDFSGLVPQYNLTAELDDINLNAIGVNNRDSISILSIDFHASGSGSSLDNFNGNGVIDSIYYINHLDTIRTRAISIFSVAEPQYKEIELESHFADIKLRGRNSFNEVAAYFAQSLSTYIPSFPEVSQIVSNNRWEKDSKETHITKKQTQFPFSDGYYQLTVEVKEANNVASVFVPSLMIAEGSSLNFFFNPYLDEFHIRAQSDYITSEDFFVEKFNMNTRNIGDSVSLYSTADVFAINNSYFPNLSILGGIKGNVMTLGLQYLNKRNNNAALINTTTSLLRNEDNEQQINIKIHPTALTYLNRRWVVSETEIVLDTTDIEVRGLNIANGNSFIDIEGVVGKSTQDTLTANFQNLDLSPFSFLTKDVGYELSGNTTGNASAVALLGDMNLMATMDFNDLKVSGHAIPDSELKSTLDPLSNIINFNLGEINSDHKPLWGSYDINQDSLVANIEFDSIPLKLLDPMLTDIITDSKGYAKSELVLSVSGKKPLSLDGTIDVKNFSTMVDFTKARYFIDPCVVVVKNNCFTLPSTKFRDSEKGSGEIALDLRSEIFQNITFNVEANFTDLLALNTTLKDNSSFFGKAYGKGRLSVRGDDSKVILDVVAQTARNSNITMPMSGAADIQEATFITFKSETGKQDDMIHDVLSKYIENNARNKKATNSSILEMNFALDVLPNTLAQIELDAKVGDIIKARGNGRINIQIIPHYDVFNMTGPVEITEGNYLFTLQTIINKRFEVEPGGTLLWTGDPTDPDVNLTALYKLKTSVAPLTGNTQDNTQTNIDCGIILGGKLMQPDISFSITAPTADTETQNALRNALNTEEALSMQFLSLMLANSFMADMQTSSIGTMGSSVAGVTGVEFLSNQLSNLISSDKFDIRLGYKPQSTTSSDEFSAGVGGDIIEDVLSFEVDGNYNTGNNSQSNSQNPFTVDAYVTWNINKSGTLKLKGFTRTIDRFDETQGMQESGVGIYFKQDFNNFKDLQKRLRENFSVDSTKQIKRRESRAANRKNKEK